MNLRTDPYTGEQYDADKWYRGEMGIWHNVEAEKRRNEEIRQYVSERRETRNRNRIARGKKRKSESQFNRSSSRYSEFCREDSGLSFGEWLREQKYRSRMGY